MSDIFTPKAMEEFKITGIVNDDGTDFDPPENPLKEKWNKLYPPMRDGEPCSHILGHYEDGRPIVNYSCVLCKESKCQYSDSWKVPEEDKEEYEKYQEEYNKYMDEHNPSIISMTKKYLKEMLENDAS